MSDWQPIETAPKDGRAVLLWIPAPAGMVELCYWNTAKDQDHWLESCGFRLQEQPTHWMPLPEPPQMPLDTPRENG
jgi:hypothetical protein